MKDVEERKSTVTMLVMQKRCGVIDIVGVVEILSEIF